MVSRAAQQQAVDTHGHCWQALQGSASSPPDVAMPTSMWRFYVSSTLAALLFAQGFFLARHELPQRSSCLQHPLPQSLLNASHNAAAAVHSENGCWLPSRYSHLIVVLIDALRYDFVRFNATHERLQLASNATSPLDAYTNRMPSVHEALARSPLRSMLFSLYADAPTVTLQRLIALSTGSLPTFIDFANNFASSELPSDNLIYQFTADRGEFQSNAVSEHNSVSDSKRLWDSTFMGDDTWMNLFPDSFTRAFPYPSFNVKDLHTVDNGCIEHLLPQLESRIVQQQLPRTLTIAHFLGVDHVGHRHHASHATMSVKLQQLDGMLQQAIEFVDRIGARDAAASAAAAAEGSLGALLVVFGDHGMTEDGNHGGATSAETGTALFVHSSTPLISSRSDSLMSPILGDDVRHSDTTESTRQVAQIDLVPTLALLMGVPIPFGSLGNIIPELFVSSRDSLRTLAEALAVNAHQVWRYLQAYQAVASSMFEHAQLSGLKATLDRADQAMLDMFADPSTTPSNSDPRYYLPITLYRELLAEIIAMCRLKWATFDLSLMALGIVLCAVSCCMACCAKPSPPPHALASGLWEWLAICAITSLVAFACRYLFPFMQLVSILGFAMPVALLFTRAWQAFEPLFERTSPRLFAFSLFSYFSGSHQQRISRLIVACCILAYMQGLFTNSYILFEAQVTYFLSASLLLILGLLRSSNARDCLILLASWKSIQIFGHDVLPSSALSLSFFSSFELVAIIASLALLVFMARNSNACHASINSWHSWIMRRLFVLTLFACFMYWCFQSSSSPEGGSLDASTTNAALSSTVSFVIRIVLPHIVYAVAYVGSSILLFASSPSLKLKFENSPFEHVGSMHNSENGNDAPLHKFATGTVTRRRLALMNDHQNARIEPAKLLVSKQHAVADLTADSRTYAFSPVAALIIPSLLLLLGPKSSILVASFLMMVFHMPTLQRGDEAMAATLLYFCSLFLFFAFSHSQALSALQVSTAFIGFDQFYTVPAGIMLAINTFAHLILLLLAMNSLVERSQRQHEKSGALQSGSLCRIVWVLFAVRLTLTMLNSFINRRHLMVWEIFAPKFMFDAVSLLLFNAMAVIS